jgi:hypothetical protein
LSSAQPPNSHFPHQIHMISHCLHHVSLNLRTGELRETSRPENRRLPTVRQTSVSHAPPRAVAQMPQIMGVWDPCQRTGGGVAYKSSERKKSLSVVLYSIRSHRAPYKHSTPPNRQTEIMCISIEFQKRCPMHGRFIPQGIVSHSG